MKREDREKLFSLQEEEEEEGALFFIVHLLIDFQTLFYSLHSFNNWKNLPALYNLFIFNDDYMIWILISKIMLPKKSNVNQNLKLQQKNHI